MASFEEQRNSLDGLKIPGLVQSQDAVEQLSFTIDPITPMPASMTAMQGPALAEKDGQKMARPFSQGGSADMSALRAPGAADPSSSLPGLADVDTAHQPAFPVAEEHATQALRPVPTPLPGSSSSLPGLADVDTARQPVSHAGLAENSQVAAPRRTGGPSSQPGLGNLTTPLALTGQLTSGLSNAGTTSQPTSQMSLYKPGAPVLYSPGATRILPPLSQAGITQALNTPNGTQNATASRPPMVIRGNDRPDRRRTLRPPEAQVKRHVMTLAGVGLLLVITLGTLLLASPLGQNARSTFSGQPNKTSLIQNQSSSMSLVAQATATAVVHQQNDGYVPGSGGAPIVTGGPHSWPLGVCTYWANSRYHELTGNWVTWTGNAYQWVDGARAAGWNVSSSPHVPSILVLMPGVQGASGYGHVAVVEDANGDSVDTSNMNWYANGGGWDIVSHYTFHTGSGVYFIWA